MSFACLEQRMAQAYIDVFPQFAPDENAPVSISEQKAFYSLINGLYQMAFDEPLLFVASLHEDDAYPNRYKKSYGKPRLIADMRKFTKSMDGLLQAMFLLGQEKDVALNKKQAIVLSKLGVEDLTNLPSAWKWMAQKDGANISAFSHCLFDDYYPYTSQIYARLLGESAFHKVENWMLDHGYERFDVYHTIGSDCNLSLTIANPRWSEEPPRGGFEYKVKHTGIAVQFDDYVENPPILGLCIPGGMKPYLESFDTMREELQAFVVRQTKKCNMCRYCVQTDKTGSRPLAHTLVHFEGQEYRLCNYFPGYTYCWTRLDDNLVDMMIEMLSFMDTFAPMQGGGGK